MKKRLIIVYFVMSGIFWFFPLNAFSLYPPDDDSYLGKIRLDFSQAFYDYRYIAVSTGNADFHTLSDGITLASLTCLAMIPETALKNVVQQTNTKARQNFFSAATNMGNVLYAAGLGGAVYLGGLFAEKGEIRVTGRLIFESLLLAGASTTILKSILGRARPYAAKDNLDYRYFTLNDDFMSMPSGHSTVAFSVASVLADRVDTWWGYLGFYSLAGLTGISRVYLNKHWLSDVVAGATVGTLSGLAVSHAFRSRTERRPGSGEVSSNSIIILPTFNGLAIYCRL